jgi:hypothetical protein
MMQRHEYRLTDKHAGIKFRLRDFLVYIPGAFILTYGLWLSLTV